MTARIKQTPDNHLTRREKEVALLVNQGLKNKEIGAELWINESAIKNYLRNILDKLGLWNRTEVALWVESRINREIK